MKVKAIKKLGRASVYDLTVADHPNYIANGQVVHNCLKDVARVLEVPYADANEVTNSIIERSSGDERASMTIEDSFKEFKVCREFNAKYPKVLHHARKLEGMAKNLGIHAAGVVASPVALDEVIPLEIRKHEGRDVKVSAIDMYGVGAMGLLKLDVLGLRTLTVLNDAIKEVKRRHGVDIDLERLDLNDKRVLDGFTRHEYVGIFQYDSPGADKICSGVEFVHFEDIAAMTALNRPGTARSGLATQYVERKKNPKLIDKTSFHPAVSEITKDTLGIIVYQEHVLRIFTDIAGFMPSTADSLRKKIAKKFGDETIGKERENFIEGAVKNTPGMTREVAGKLMDAITFFGCLPKEVLVVTSDGCRSISDLKPGDEILSLRSDGVVVTNRVKRHASSGHKRLLEIRFTDGRKVRCSEGHWWLSEAGWVQAIRLRPGEKLISIHAIYQASSRPRTHPGQANRFDAGGLPIGRGQTQNALRRGEDGAGQVARTAPSRDGGVSGPAVGHERDRSSQGRRRDEQRRHQLGSDDARRAHDASQEGLQGAAVPSGRLFQARFQPVHVQRALSSVVSGPTGGSRLGGRLDTDRRRARAPSDRPEAVSSAELYGAFATVQSVTPAGAEETWDIECEAEPANYILANGFVSHNSYGFNKCCASDTIVIRAGARAGQTSEITVGELYAAQQSKTPWGAKIRAGKLNILQMDADGRVRPGRVKAIHANGRRDVLAITTASGRAIRVTGNHRLLTERGYVMADELVPHKSALVCMGDADAYAKKERQNERAAGRSYDGQAGGIGAPKGAANPSWLDGRTTALKAAKVAVAARAAGKCEACGASPGDGKHALEFAHTRSVEQCGGDFSVYHSPENARMLCNSCHKRFDYAKGERKVRWSRGRPTVLDVVVSVEHVGVEDVYDIEMDTTEHNFVANGIVSHNSHATAYGVIAYWCMWLKMYYPVEFYWALLKNEPQRLRIQQFAKDAKRHGVVLLPPSVNHSGKHFAIDKEGRIRGSLVDIKGVGEKAAESIIRNQPFEDMDDFLQRVDRRAVHRGVVVALAKAGAMNEIIPNPRWFVENIEAFWTAYAKGKGGRTSAIQMLEDSRKAPAWDAEEAQLIASQVNPLAFGKHPMDAYSDFIEKHVKMPIVSMSEEGFFKKYNDKNVLVGGIIVEVKLNQVGDFHTGALPSEDERKRMFWGSRYANVNVEDAGGVQNRIKHDIDIYEDMRPVIERGIGAPVLVHASVNGKYENLRAHFCVDLEGLRKKIKDGSELNIWERLVTGRHPVHDLPTTGDAKRDRARVTNRLYRSSPRGGPFYGVVTNIRLRFDKNGREMAFFGLIGGDGYFIDAICFGSNWPEVKHALSPGVFVKIMLDKQPDRHRESGVSHVFNGGLIKRFGPKRKDK